MIKVGIVGLGLIGSSLLKRLSPNKEYELFACSKSSYREAIKHTKNSSDDINIVQDCDIIFVCSKASDTIKTLDKLNKILSKNTIVVDVCSIKKELLDKKYDFNFILSHPMSGTEKTGFKNGFDKLFEGNKWLYEKENKLLIKVIKDVGSIPFKINMKDHDSICASISHFPTILSFLLFNMTKNNAKAIASSGFRDMTRLAITNYDLANSMFELNEKNLAILLEQLNSEFENLKKMNSDERIELFKEISKKRKEMYDNSGKNIFKI